MLGQIFIHMHRGRERKEEKKGKRSRGKIELPA
jgi:hypothetical protein